MTIDLVCTPRQLPEHLRIAAAERAIAHNPANRPHSLIVAHALGANPPKARLAVLTGKRWKMTPKGLLFTVGFLEAAPAALRKRILSHMNAWSKTANVKFVESHDHPMVRIAFASDPPEASGYWSYEGTDILSIPAGEPTMNLEAFSMKTPASEFHRVVRHETGHTLGFPHEHMRAELVQLIDRRKAIRFFGATQGWSPQEVEAQVLTPLEQSSIIGTPPDQVSVMCYQIPGSITKSGKPILGGLDIDKSDYDFAGAIYPKPPKPPAKKKAAGKKN
ncbi:MAG: peptidase M12 [Aquabacterium sp.]|jgi:hypothetical protein|nr:MAG: peptidase M12 [Aquabacterium sp.]